MGIPEPLKEVQHKHHKKEELYNLPQIFGTPEPPIRGAALNALFRFHQMRDVKKHSKQIYSLVIIKKENARAREGMLQNLSILPL